MALLRALRMGLGVALCLSAISCGGGGGGGGGTTTPPPPPPTVNTTSVIVDQGPATGNGSVNTLFTSVKVCVPGSTTSCQTIDHIQVDTGSYGLRLLAPVLTLTLPVETLSSGGSLVECTQFVDGYSWGPVALADLTIAGETAKSLPVQVIGQEWAFTYRYPGFGGVETSHLVIPVNETIEFHVTSLDVIHSFWAYQLGVKADANPGVDNVAFVKPTKIETFEIHCAELCGIWHGGMFDHGHVVSDSEFERWISEQQTRFAATTKVLPKYSTTYTPEPLERGE